MSSSTKLRGAARPARRSRRHREPVDLPARIVRAFIGCAAVRREIEFNRRKTIMAAANALIAHGISQNRAAEVLEICASRLCEWRQLVERFGIESLRPPPSTAGRKSATGRNRQHSAFLEIQTR